MFRRGTIKLIDGLYWSLYWLEDLDNYNKK
jgi:hypothetical protein